MSILSQDHLIVLMSIRTGYSMDQTHSIADDVRDRCVRDLKSYELIKGTPYGWRVTLLGKDICDKHKWAVVEKDTE
jgi:hypothetical protein